MPQLFSSRKRINREILAKFSSLNVWTWPSCTELLYFLGTFDNMIPVTQHSGNASRCLSLKWELSFFGDAPSQQTCVDTQHVLGNCCSSAVWVTACIHIKLQKVIKHGNGILSCTTENPRLACTAQTALTWRMSLLTFSSPMGFQSEFQLLLSPTMLVFATASSLGVYWWSFFEIKLNQNLLSKCRHPICSTKQELVQCTQKHAQYRHQVLSTDFSNLQRHFYHTTTFANINISLVISVL